MMFDEDAERFYVALEADRDSCDDYCRPVTNPRRLRVMRFATHQPREEYL